MSEIPFDSSVLRDEGKDRSIVKPQESVIEAEKTSADVLAVQEFVNIRFPILKDKVNSLLAMKEKIEKSPEVDKILRFARFAYRIDVENKNIAEDTADQDDRYVLNLYKEDHQKNMPVSDEDQRLAMRYAHFLKNAKENLSQIEDAMLSKNNTNKKNAKETFDFFQNHRYQDKTYYQVTQKYHQILAKLESDFPPFIAVKTNPEIPTSQNNDIKHLESAAKHIEKYPGDEIETVQDDKAA